MHEVHAPRLGGGHDELGIGHEAPITREPLRVGRLGVLALAGHGFGRGRALVGCEHALASAFRLAQAPHDEGKHEGR